MLKIVIFGLIVHALFLASIFQIYFKSPIISGLQAQPDLDESPAKRYLHQMKRNLYFIITSLDFHREQCFA